MKKISILLVIALFFSCSYNQSSVKNDEMTNDTISFDSFDEKISDEVNYVDDSDLIVMIKNKENEIDSIYSYLISELNKSDNPHYKDMANLLLEEKNNYKEFYSSKCLVFGASFKINNTVRYQNDIYFYDLKQHYEYVLFLKENVYGNYLDSANF